MRFRHSVLCLILSICPWQTTRIATPRVARQEEEGVVGRPQETVVYNVIGGLYVQVFEEDVLCIFREYSEASVISD